MSARYRFHTDPAHGWLEVPRADLAALGILHLISAFSYQSRDGQTVYLEEDCDASRFVEAWEALHGQKYDPNRDQHVDHPHSAPCRALPHFRASELEPVR